MKNIEQNNNIMLNILRTAFPGRGIARLSKPRPAHLGGCDFYFAWPADHLSAQRTTSNQEQAGLCRYVSQMITEDTVLLIGLNAAFYQKEAESMASWVQKGSPFSVWLVNYVQYVTDEDEDIDENILRQEFEQVAAEIQEHQTLCPSVNLADVPPWRVPLSIAVQKLEHRMEKLS
ncbi:MAG: hypothetical protein KGY38_08645 [Desulfobacterales bacterium]|nr:hypothetical protein [Desulfobacterales bacterium]